MRTEYLWAESTGRDADDVSVLRLGDAYVRTESLHTTTQTVSLSYSFRVEVLSTLE